MFFFRTSFCYCIYLFYILSNFLDTSYSRISVLVCMWILGIYSDEETVEQPIDITAVAIIANEILFVALTIDCSAGHESDMNAYGVKKVKIFTAEDSVNVLEKLLEIVPADSSSILLPAIIPSSVVRDTAVDVDLDLEFREAEVKVPRVRSKKNIQSSEGESDDDDGGSDSTGDSEGDQDLALYLEEAENLSRTANCNKSRGVAYKPSRLDFKATTHSQGTNTSLFNIGFQSKCTLSNRGGANGPDATSLPDSSSRRIRMFDLQEVRSVVSSSSSLVLQRGHDAVAFTGTLQSAITVQVTILYVLLLSDYFLAFSFFSVDFCCMRDILNKFLNAVLNEVSVHRTILFTLAVPFRVSKLYYNNSLIQSSFFLTLSDALLHCVTAP
jgi:hypothetical protein